MVAPKALKGIRDAAIMAEMYPFVKNEVDKLDRALDNRMLMAIRKGELTPQMALQGWIEKVSYRELLSKFDQTIKLGQHLGHENQASLDKGVFNI